MSVIKKTKAVVLKKIDYSDTSKIAGLYSEDEGKISVIVKGGRTAASKTGKIIEPFNIVEIVTYSKPSRELQIVNQAEILFYPKNIFSDIEKVKYASCILELIDKLLVEHDKNKKLFFALEKVIEMIDSGSNQPREIFLRFFFYLLKEIGYQITTEVCNDCRTNLTNQKKIFFDFEKGLICDDCHENHAFSHQITLEQFEIFTCLSRRALKNHSTKDLDWIIKMFEKFLMFHIPDFRGLNSLKMFN